ncbi:hypothetical protein AB0F81_22915 [Actinoplanes sp. NPDC024001]|uniref:hypothetical protein n=1 Tax=Actinoplanes sp. NPDC024001 TaxID=3154598 RepID=UPI0033D227D4
MRATPLLTAAVLVLAAGAPAHAEPARVTMTFTIAAAEVKQGTRVTLSGRAGFGATGNAGPVELYFRKQEAHPFVRIGATTAAASGAFSATLTARASGEYQAVYRGNHLRGRASGSDYLAVYTTRTADRKLFSWSGTRVQCHPDCAATGPGQTLGPGPVRLTFRRSCAQPDSSGVLAFTAEPGSVPKPGTPGWRHFPPGATTTDIDLVPPVRTGHFHLRWHSPAGKNTTCDLAFTATQQVEQKNYI